MLPHSAAPAAAGCVRGLRWDRGNVSVPTVGSLLAMAAGQRQRSFIKPHVLPEDLFFYYYYFYFFMFTVVIFVIVAFLKTKINQL